MKPSQSQIYTQLKESCEITGAYWAVWLERTSDWEVLSVYKLNKSDLSIVLEFIRSKPIQSWLDAKLEGENEKPRFVKHSISISGDRIYAFPNLVTLRVIVVGANRLKDVTQRYWQKVTLGNLYKPLLSFDSTIDFLPDFGIPYYLPEILNRVLDMILQVVDCDKGWLAVRTGDYLEIKICKKCEINAERKISIEANPLLRELTRTHEIKVINKNDVEWAMVPRICDLENAQSWGIAPIVMGQRLISFVAFWYETAKTEINLNELKELSKRVSPSVEASITFSDLSEHLGRMALLNDFAVTITSALDTEQIAQRLFALLQRTFGTERINMSILLANGSGFQKYTKREGTLYLQTIYSDDETIDNLFETGDVQRVVSRKSDPNFSFVYPGSNSTLIIPMKYHKQLIGTLGLESDREGAFSIYDEHLLMVMASHLAGLLENGRLRREAENRASNLELIHEVIGQIVGLTDMREISQITAELLAQNFAYELAVIGLIEGPELYVNVAGIGGSAAELVQQGLQYMDESRKDGIVMRVAVTGESILVNDVSKSPFYRPIPNWDANSEMCVALKNGEQIIGIVDVESQRKNAFTNNDVIMLESLAGILSNVMSSAGQYQNLQATVNQLNTAREELQQRIVAQRMAESRLVQAAKLAAVGEMAAGIAHELNNPLTTVSGFTELVLEDIPDGFAAREDLELILREAQRARGVVRRLLDFARQSESARTRLDINEIVEDVLALVNHLLRTSGVVLISEFTKDLPWISVDRNQIKQVILNLIHNALHAMPTGGEINISTLFKQKNKRSWILIRISDTGTGIAPENIEQIFEPFFTTRSKDGGTGLGLTVTNGIIADHGGFITVESQVGEGTSFSVWLPIEETNG